MTVNEFLAEFQDLLQRDEEIVPSTVLSDMEEWDSMSIMACMAWFDVKFEVKMPYKVYAEQETVQDIIALSNGRIV